MTDRFQTAARNVTTVTAAARQGDLLCRGSLWITARRRTVQDATEGGRDLARLVVKGERPRRLGAPLFRAGHDAKNKPQSVRVCFGDVAHISLRIASRDGRKIKSTVHPICGDAPETHRASPCVLRQIANLHARRGAMQSCMRQTATESDWSVDNFNRCAKHVPDPALGKDVAWVRRIGLELASQPHDLRVDGTIVDVIAVKAGHVEELVAR